MSWLHQSKLAHVADMTNRSRRRTDLVGVLGFIFLGSDVLTCFEDLQNTLFELTLNEKLYLAPVKTIHNCLDVGTGTGIWAIDFGTRNSFAPKPTAPTADVFL